MDIFIELLPISKHNNIIAAYYNIA